MTKDSNIVANILEGLKDQDSDTFSDLRILLGPSGCGKTKAGFDVLRKRWGLFLDMESKTQTDIREMLKNIRLLVATEQLSEYEPLCEAEIRLTVLARLLLLLLMYLMKKVTTPEQWLFAQLNGLYGSVGIIRGYLDKVIKSEGHKLTMSLLPIVLSYLHKTLEGRIVCFVDETNVLLNELDGETI